MGAESKLPTPPVAAAQNRLGLGLIGLALTSTLLASTCCVLPLVLVLLGVGGAWMANLAVLKPYTEPLVAIALIALIWAGYLLFRPTQACAPEGRECDDTRRTARKVYMVCAVFIGVLLLFPFAAPLFY